MGKLTARGVQTKGPGTYQDGEGLMLVVSPKGAKRWILRLTVDGRRRDMGLGSFPEVSLDQARKDAAVARQQREQGLDPVAARRAKVATTPTFISAAAAFIRMNRRAWSNPKHGRQWCATLKTYARPVIGTKPVDKIGTEDILKVLQPIWVGKTETAKRVQGRLENILDFATARKWRAGENPARWRGHLDTLLPAPRKVTKPVHHPAMPYGEVPAFLAELRGNTSTSSKALQWLILTATRTNEVLGATWSEIDQTGRVWVIPGERMKAGRAHRVPLTDACLKILQSLPRVVGNPYLFPGRVRGRPLSGMALLQLMRGMGYGVAGERGDYVPHGFRSSFRDWAGEVSSASRDVCEMALAHTVANQVEAAYRRGDLFAKRTAMMEQWSSWCGSHGHRGAVVPFPGAAAGAGWQS